MIGYFCEYGTSAWLNLPPTRKIPSLSDKNGLHFRIAFAYGDDNFPFIPMGGPGLV